MRYINNAACAILFNGLDCSNVPVWCCLQYTSRLNVLFSTVPGELNKNPCKTVTTSEASNFPYSFNLGLMSVFGTANRRFQALHTTFRRVLRRVPGSNVQ